MNYLCLWLSLFGIFAFKNLNRSSLRFFVLACESTQKQTTHKLKLIYRTTLNIIQVLHVIIMSFGRYIDQKQNCFN